MVNITKPYSVKRSDVDGNPFEWLLCEKKELYMSLSPTLHCIYIYIYILLAENIAGQGF